MLRLLVTLVIAWGVIVAVMLIFERRFIYFPVERHDNVPADYKLRAEDVWLRASDGVRLHGWWIDNESDSLEPARGAKPPSASERGWGPARTGKSA